jgi:hypothetical protein
LTGRRYGRRWTGRQQQTDDDEQRDPHSSLQHNQFLLEIDVTDV